MLHSSYTPPPRRQPLVLAVDDDRTLRMMLCGMVEALGYTVLEAANGKDALAILEEKPQQIDAILLDREMPMMDGMELTMRMKENGKLRKIPIIMQTGADKPEQIKQGIDAGVFYYLTKPVNQDILKSVLLAAIRESEQQRLLSTELQKHKTSFHMIDTCRFQLRTLAEAEHLAAFLANCFPEPDRTVSGLAELLVNAVEHGNLCIDYHDKTRLVEEGNWRSEVERRQSLAEHRQKRVDVMYRKKPEGSFVTIKDEGKGFDWKNYLQVDPSRASHNHGRGIAQANAISFDKITFNESGNEVSGFVSNDKPLEW